MPSPGARRGCRCEDRHFSRFRCVYVVIGFRISEKGHSDPEVGVFTLAVAIWDKNWLFSDSFREARNR